MNNSSEQIKLKNSFTVLSKENKKYFLTFLKLLIAAGLLLFLINWINPSQIINAIKSANVIYILSSVLLLIPNVYIQFLKWRLTTQSLLNDFDDKKIFNSLFYGFAGGVFTPARIGEYFGRGVAFNDKPIFEISIATFIDKIFLLIIVAFFGSIASLIFIKIYYKVPVMITVGLIIVMLILFYFLFLFISSDYLQKIIKDKFNQLNKFRIISDSLLIIRQMDKVYSSKMIVLSAMLYICFIIQYAFLVMSFSNDTHFLQYVLTGNLVMFSKSIIPPVSLGELGIREGASVFFITAIGQPASVGFNASIFLFIINILLPAIFGLILLIKKNNG